MGIVCPYLVFCFWNPHIPVKDILTEFCQGLCYQLWVLEEGIFFAAGHAWTLTQFFCPLRAGFLPVSNLSGSTWINIFIPKPFFVALARFLLCCYHICSSLLFPQTMYFLLTLTGMVQKNSKCCVRAEASVQYMLVQWKHRYETWMYFGLDFNFRNYMLLK